MLSIRYLTKSQAIFAILIKSHVIKTDNTTLFPQQK